MIARIECKKGTKVKFTYGGGNLNYEKDIKKKWYMNYGFIENTLQMDGDALDTYIIGKEDAGTQVEVFPLCMLYVIDNGQIDHKLVTATQTGRCHFLNHKLHKLVKHINRKKGVKVLKLTYSTDAIRYEVAKCKAFYKLFKEA